MENGKGEKLSLSTKIGFGLGDIYGGGSLMIIGFYYLYFLTDILLIDAKYAGIVFLISKAWDAVSDPIMGYLSDRTRTRFGRRRPYFLAGIVLIFLSFFMMWYPVDFSRELHRVVYVLIAYLFFSTVITMVMVPYNALASELTLDYNERTSLSSFRIFFSSVSSLVCAVLPMEIVKMFPSERQGFVVMAVSFGLFFALPFLATFFSTEERKEFQGRSEGIPFIRVFTEPFKTPTFVHVLLMYLFAFVAMDMVMAIVIYFMTYYLHRGGETNYVLGVLLVVQILALPFFYWVSRRTSKKTGYIIAALIWIGVMLVSFLITPDLQPFYIYVFGAIVGLSTGGVVIMIYSIFPDVPDVDELYSGQRREGIYSGLYTFMRKLSSAVGIFLISNAISIAGYRKPVRQVIDGVEKMVQQEQSQEFILVLRVVFVVLPVIFLAGALLFAFRYTLTPGLHARLKAYLDRRRTGEGDDGTFAREERELKNALRGETR